LSNEIFLTVAIPAFNRPETLLRLLKSVDALQFNSIEILIIEDCSPRRSEIKSVVGQFKESTGYFVNYIENDSNLGFDKNIRELVKRASGDFVLFMGDDDVFVPDALGGFIDFIKDHREYGFFLKSSQHVHESGEVEPFRYFDGNVFNTPSEASCVSFFRKSSYLAGLTINKSYAQNFLTDKFDGSLLCEVYLCAEMAINYKSAYYDEILTERKNGGVPFFGSSESESDLYEPGVITIDNSINFLQGYFKVTAYLDEKYGFNLTKSIKRDMSKYLYHSIAIQRHRPLPDFLQYISRLNDMGFNCNVYYYIYVVGLLFLGKQNCDSIIVRLKKLLRKTPSL
jgi:abequosyltransferase